jgi:16S rRNA (guanine966-N2)-methyltransferase
MSKSNLSTKIIAGKYKGKSLQLPDLQVTRSSKSILKESFFNVVQFDIIDKIFVEAFGGSGSIGLEALSRDAKHSYFCEIDRKSYKVLDSNCRNIDPVNSTVIFGDTFEKIPSILQKLEDSDDEIIVYIDPPFDFRDGMDAIYEKSFVLVKNIKNDNIALITFEHVSTLEMPENLGKFTKQKTKKFGKSSLTYYV